MDQKELMVHPIALDLDHQVKVEKQHLIQMVLLVEFWIWSLQVLVSPWGVQGDLREALGMTWKTTITTFTTRPATTATTLAAQRSTTHARGEAAPTHLS